MVVGVPGEHLVDLVAAVAEDGDPLGRQRDVFDVGVGLEAALLHLRQEEEAVAIWREHRMLLDVQPGQLQSAFGVGLYKTEKELL